MDDGHGCRASSLSLVLRELERSRNPHLRPKHDVGVFYLQACPMSCECCCAARHATTLVLALKIQNCACVLFASKCCWFSSLSH